MSRPVFVVAGLFVSSDRKKVLMAKRRSDDLRPDLWEYPGGKLELMERERGALKREIQEELGVLVSVKELISIATIPAERTLHLLLYHVVQLDSDEEPQPLASQSLIWVRPQDAILHLPLSPATYWFYNDVMAFLEDHR